jgi:hypothetical protein
MAKIMQHKILIFELPIIILLQFLKSIYILIKINYFLPYYCCDLNIFDPIEYIQKLYKLSYCKYYCLIIQYI